MLVNYWSPEAGFPKPANNQELGRWTQLLKNKKVYKDIFTLVVANQTIQQKTYLDTPCLGSVNAFCQVHLWFESLWVLFSMYVIFLCAQNLS